MDHTHTTSDIATRSEVSETCARPDQNSATVSVDVGQSSRPQRLADTAVFEGERPQRPLSADTEEIQIQGSSTSTGLTRSTSTPSHQLGEEFHAVELRTLDHLPSREAPIILPTTSSIPLPTTTKHDASFPPPSLVPRGHYGTDADVSRASVLSQLSRIHSVDSFRDVDFAIQNVERDETVIAQTTRVTPLAQYASQSSPYFHDENRRPECSSPDMPHFPSRPTAFRPIHQGSPSRHVTPRCDVPSRARSHVSSRAASRTSAVDLNWLGPLVTKFAEDASEREKRDADERRRLLDEARVREQNAFDLAASQEKQNIELMRNIMREREQAAIERERLALQKEREQNEMALRKAEKELELKMQHEREQHELALQQQELALMRENKIREDMRQLAALETRNILLEQQLKGKMQQPLYFEDDLTASQQPSEIHKRPPQIQRTARPGSPALDEDGEFVQSHTIVTESMSTETKTASVIKPIPITHVYDSEKQISDYPVVQSPVTPEFVTPLLPPVCSMNLVPISAIYHPTSETLQKLTIVNTPTGPAVQLFPLPSPNSMLRPTQTSQTYTHTSSTTSEVTSSLTVNAAAVNQTDDAGALTPATQHKTAQATNVASSSSLASSLLAPTIVVNTPQSVRPYSGKSSWKSFKEHFERVARVNGWESDHTKAQHLMCSLEGAAVEILKDICDSSPTVYQDIWEALAKRYGDVDEVRESMRKFEQRKQLEGESVVEFQQALRSLYRTAWPNATPQQREVALKTHFEEGVSNNDLHQFLRLHALNDTFEQTVQKARRFAATLETPKPRKQVRISTPPSHDSVQTVQKVSIHDRMDKLEGMIRSLQTTRPRSQTPPPRDPSVKCVNNDNKQSSRQNPASQPKAETAYGYQQRPSNNRNKPRFVQPFNDGAVNNHRQRQTSSGPPPLMSNTGQTTVNQNFAQRTFRPRNQQRPTGVPPRCCWICWQPGCHSANHENRTWTPPPRPPEWNVCWTCGQYGCRSWYHGNEGPPQQGPSTQPGTTQPSGNAPGPRTPGARDPSLPARPASH